MMSYIRFKGTDFPLREAIKNGQTILVASESLDKALCPNGEDYCCPEAKAIDENIFCFVPDEVIDVSDDELNALVDEFVD